MEILPRCPHCKSVAVENSYWVVPTLKFAGDLAINAAKYYLLGSKRASQVLTKNNKTTYRCTKCGYKWVE